MVSVYDTEQQVFSRQSLSFELMNLKIVNSPKERYLALKDN